MLCLSIVLFTFVLTTPTLYNDMLVKDNMSAQVSAVYLAQSIEVAHSNISHYIVRTPVFRLPWLDAENREVWAKLECHQYTEFFKYSGSFNTLSKAKSKEAITASAGYLTLETATAGLRLGNKMFTSLLP